MKSAVPAQRPESIWLIFLVFLRLGLTSFGGPVAHLAYFQHEFVERRGWLSAASYADLVALCQFLPGPASSQVGFALGLMRGGYRGAFAAWLGFTLPSAGLLIAFAYSLQHYAELLPSGLLSGVQVAAVAVVAHAVWSMGRQLCTDLPRILIMLASCSWILYSPSSINQLLIILFSAIIGRIFLHSNAVNQFEVVVAKSSQQRGNGLIWLLIFALLLIGLPWLSHSSSNLILQQFDAFYRAGALVFGGGHVVLPTLQTAVVDSGWISAEQFIVGYSAAQAVPGPLFTVAAFIGASINSPLAAWLSGLICLVAIFLPSWLLVLAALPSWQQLRQQTSIRQALAGVNAAVVGLLLAAFYQPVWQSSIHNTKDLLIALLAWLALAVWKLPAWLVVLACGLIYSVFG